MSARSEGEAVPAARDLASRFANARSRVLGRRLSDLESDRLLRIEQRLERELRERYADMERLEADTGPLLEAGDWQQFEEVRTRALDVSEEFEATRELHRNVRHTRLEKQLTEAIEGKLGSKAARRAYDAFIMLLILGVIAMLGVQELELTPITPEVETYLDIADVSACAVFLLDFFWRMVLAEDRRWFLRRYWIDFVTSIPIPSSFLRIGRLVRFVRLARMVRLDRLVRAIFFFWRGMDKLAATLDVRMMQRSLKILVAVLLLGGVGIYWAEGSPNAEGAEDLGQSIWWSFATVVTGGFADLRNPDTVTGRILTAALIVSGMVVVGIFTATLTSILVRENDHTAAILATEERIREELQELREQIAKAEGESPAQNETPPEES